MKSRCVSRSACAIPLMMAAGPTFAYDLTDKLALHGLLAAAGQCQDVAARLPSEDDGQPLPGTEPVQSDTTLQSFGNACRGALPVQLQIDFNPTERDEFFLKLAWAVDNGLNAVSPFRLAPWAADLEDDVQDINGSARSYLLAAWYRHSFALAGENRIAATLGIIDSTDYLDGNAYANDEYTQFMNEAFVNAGNYNLPSYDAGVALEGSFGRFSVNALGMNIHENDVGNNYNFWGLQLGWHPQFKLGAGNYRINLLGASSAFLAPSRFVVPDPDADADQDLVLVDGEERVAVPGGRASRLSWGLSFDQAIGARLGLFLRLTWQSTDAAVDYQALYSGGIDLSGDAWRRPEDNIGLGYAYLEGGNTDVKRTNVFEAYYRASLNDYLAVTADIQYMSDALAQIDPEQEDPEGWIFGLRATAEF